MPAQRVQNLIVEVAEARQRLEEKIRILQSLREAAISSDVEEGGRHTAHGRAWPLSDLTVQNYRSFFANASNAKYLFGIDGRNEESPFSADTLKQNPVAVHDVPENGPSLLQIRAEQSLHQTSTHSREIPYQNLWDFHGVPGMKCETKCMAVSMCKWPRYQSVWIWMPRVLSSWHHHINMFLAGLGEDASSLCSMPQWVSRL